MIHAGIIDLNQSFRISWTLNQIIAVFTTEYNYIELIYILHLVRFFLFFLQREMSYMV